MLSIYIKIRLRTEKMDTSEMAKLRVFALGNDD